MPVMSIKLSDDDAEMIRSLFNLRHQQGDIPEATPSAYLRFLLFRDAQETAATIEKRRRQLAA